MKKVFLFLFPTLLVVSVLLTEKPQPPEVYLHHITTASLRDTLPEQTYAALNVREINGIRIQRNSGVSTFYFEYEANHDNLIRAINESPFFIHSLRSDSSCRKITYADAYPEIESLSNDELNSVSFFMNIDPKQFRYFECIKSPLKHTLILSVQSDKVLHKVELI